MAPVMASAAVRCVWVIFFVAPIDPLIGLLVFSSYVGRSHTLAAYSVRGMATARYSWRMSFVGIPCADLERHLMSITYRAPFAIAYAVCSFHLSSWSRMTPRNLCMREGFIIAPQIVIGGRSLSLFREKSISANLLGSKRELCSDDHSKPPPLLSSISSSI